MSPMLGKVSANNLARQPKANDDQVPDQQGSRFRAQFYKTDMCRFFKSGCRNGTSCPFAHGDTEMSLRPDLTKTSLCQRFVQGTCPFSAAECRFAHGPLDLRQTDPFASEQTHLRQMERPPNGSPKKADTSNSVAPLAVHRLEKADVGMNVFASHQGGTGDRSVGRSSLAATLSGVPLPVPQVHNNVNSGAKQLSQQSAASLTYVRHADDWKLQHRLNSERDEEFPYAASYSDTWWTEPGYLPDLGTECRLMDRECWMAYDAASTTAGTESLSGSQQEDLSSVNDIQFDTHMAFPSAVLPLIASTSPSCPEELRAIWGAESGDALHW